MDGRAGDATSPAPHLAARIDLQRCLWTPGHQINYIWWEFYLFPILHVRWGARYIRFPLQGTPRDHHPIDPGAISTTTPSAFDTDICLHDGWIAGRDATDSGTKEIRGNSG